MKKEIPFYLFIYIEASLSQIQIHTLIHSTPDHKTLDIQPLPRYKQGMGQPDHKPNDFNPDTDELLPREKAYVLLRQNGMTVKEIEKAFKLKPKSGYNIEKKTKRKDLTSTPLVSEAIKVKKKLMKGEVWGDIKNVKASDANAAADSILDRYQPKVQRHENTTLNLNVSVCDLEEYRGLELPAPGDVPALDSGEDVVDVEAIEDGQAGEEVERVDNPLDKYAGDKGG